tara:strand:- start:766 stop:1041 length:276 start_codon:yes stop_codon:yes gene_type:complete
MEHLVLMVVRDTLLVVDKVENLLLVLVDMVAAEIFQVVLALLTLAVVEHLEMIVDLAVLVVAVSLLFVTQSKYLKKSYGTTSFTRKYILRI